MSKKNTYQNIDSRVSISLITLLGDTMFNRDRCLICNRGLDLTFETEDMWTGICTKCSIQYVQYENQYGIIRDREYILIVGFLHRIDICEKCKRISVVYYISSTLFTGKVCTTCLEYLLNKILESIEVDSNG